MKDLLLLFLGVFIFINTSSQPLSNSELLTLNNLGIHFHSIDLEDQKTYDSIKLILDTEYKREDNIARGTIFGVITVLLVVPAAIISNENVSPAAIAASTLSLYAVGSIAFYLAARNQKKERDQLLKEFL